MPGLMGTAGRPLICLTGRALVQPLNKHPHTDTFPKSTHAAGIRLRQCRRPPTPPLINLIPSPAHQAVAMLTPATR